MFKAGDVVKRRDKALPSEAWRKANRQEIYTLKVKCIQERFGNRGFLADHNIEGVGPDFWWAESNFIDSTPVALKSVRDYL